MITTTSPTAQDETALRRAGGVSICGALLCVVVFVFVGAVIGADPPGLAGPVARFPEIRALRTVENGLYLTVLLLWLPLPLELSRRLMTLSPAAAMAGAALNVLGLTVMAAGALPHVITSRLADLYHAPEATSADQAAILVVWQATLGLFDTLLLVGLIMVSAGVVLLGLAMLRAPQLRGVAPVSLGLGLVGLVAELIMLIDPGTPVVAVGLLTLVVFHLMLGGKVRAGAHRSRGTAS